jgi:phosphoenolpyruvate-protein kinase (PTS system EI component)
MGELLLQGLPAAPGSAAGPARLAHSPAGGDGTAAPLPDGARAPELERAQGALDRARDDLERLGARLRAAGRADEAEIVETGVLMAGDPALAAALEAAVLGAGRRAEQALVEAAGELAKAIAALGDERLAARADDVRSLGRRAAAHAVGGTRPGDAAAPAGPVVLVADDLGPADVAELGDAIAAVALAGGSPTAHAAVVARGLGIPMAVGLGDALLRARPGDPVAVDGTRGSAALDPSPARLAAARADTERRRADAERERARSTLPAVTRDGLAVRVLVNVATAGELEHGLRAGADGVGLLRTELAFLEAPGWPGEDEHRRALEPVLAPLAGRTATVRLLDFGGDKTPPFLVGTGLRGIALLLAAPAALAAQARAIAAAGAATDLRVLLPLAESAAEVDAVRALLPAGTRVGAMVETGTAAARAGELAAAADFLSIGTNDLTHSVLGSDRFATGTAATHDPRVLERIAAVADAARAHARTLEVCGEAASDPVLVPLLVGLGVGELSVGAARVAAVRELVRGLDAGAARALARRALGAPDAAAVAALVGQAADAARERLDGVRGVVPVGPQA